jgi:hypothetical protein
VFVVFRREIGASHLVSARRLDRDPGPSHGSSLEISFVDSDGATLEALVTRSGRYELETAGGKKIAIQAACPQAWELPGPWQVSFPEGWGAPKSIDFEKLMSWTQHPDDGVKYFSGVATYETEFEMPDEMLGHGIRLWLDLGRVGKVGDVKLNGKALGTVWKPPFHIDVTEAVRAGSNKLAIDVANTWSNRLVGDALSPDGKQYCQTNIIESRSWRVKWKDTPLIESGLLGPVRLVPATVVQARMGQSATAR